MIHAQKVEDHFDQNANLWHNLYIKPGNANDVVLQDRMKISFELVKKHVKPGSHILDAGCGAGLLSHQLAREGYTVCGVDISSVMIQKCRDQFNQSFPGNHSHRFLVGNLSELDLEKESFDCIAALGYLEYQEDEASSIHHFYSLLKPGGWLIITGPQEKSIALVLSTWFSRMTRKPSPRPDISINLYGKSRFNELLVPGGFEVKDVYRHGFASFPVIGGGRKGIVLHKFLSALSKVIPIKAFCNDIVVAACKSSQPQNR